MKHKIESELHHESGGIHAKMPRKMFWNKEKSVDFFHK